MIYLILIFGFLCRSSIYKYYKIQITEKYSTDMKIWHEHRWGLMTITTVGYDLNPRTLLGFDFKKILWWNIVLGCTGSDQAFFGQLRFQENWLEGSALSPGFSFSPCPFLSWWTALLSSTRTDSGETRWGRSWCWRSSSPSWLAHHRNGDGQVEHKKKERIKQLAADRRTAQKFFLIQEMLVLKMTLMMVDYDEMMVTDDDDGDNDDSNFLGQAMVNAAGVSFQAEAPPNMPKMTTTCWSPSSERKKYDMITFLKKCEPWHRCNGVKYIICCLVFLLGAFGQ